MYLSNETMAIVLRIHFICIDSSALMMILRHVDVCPSRRMRSGWFACR